MVGFYIKPLLLFTVRVTIIAFKIKIGLFFSFIAKANEFIFLELNSPISQREELKLKDIMMEIGATNGELQLSCPLPWVQAFPLFQDLSPQEISFLHYYCASASSFPAVAGADMKKKPVSQVSM